MEKEKSEKTEHVEYTGYKFLDRELKSKYGTTWQIGKWKTQVINEGDRDGSSCGVGLHLMKKPNPVFMAYAIGFLAKGRGLLGMDDDKMRFEQVKLIRPLRFSEIFYPGADLKGADLKGADLTRANLTGANLTGADLTGANLIWANLSEANLIWANLSEANLTRADLTRADLIWTNLRDADLTGAHGLAGTSGLSHIQRKQIHC